MGILERKFYAVLHFGPLTHTLEIRGPRADIRLAFPRHNLNIDVPRMGIEAQVAEYVEATFRRMETGHETEEGIWINYELWSITYKM